MIIQPLLRVGRLVPLAAALAACTVQGEETTEATDRTTQPAASTPGTTPAAAAPQGQDVPDQRRATLIAESLREAERALELKLWQDAARIAGQVLDLEPSNQRAREILFTAQDLLGGQQPSVAREAQDRELLVRVGAERDRDRARHEMGMGDAAMEAGRFGDAVEAYQRGLLVLRYSVYFQPGNDLEREIERKLSEAQLAQVRAEQDVEERRRAASRAQLEEEENRLRIQRQARVKRLLDQANTDFQLNNFAAAVRNLEMALADDPTNANARALHELATRARHDQAIELLRQDWKAEWAKTFDDLRTSDVPQSTTVEYDMERWAQIAGRGPITFTPPEELESPEERAIFAKLRSTVVDHRFAEATVQDWAAYYGNLTGVTFVVSKEVAELDPETTRLRDFSLPNASVEQALNVIRSLTNVHWKVESGMVRLVTAEKAGGRVYVSHYPVGDLVRGVADRPGRSLKLTVPGEDSGTDFGDEEEPKPTVVDTSRLETMIRENVAVGSWEGGDGLLTIQKDVLIVRNTREAHEAVQKLLSELRQAVGILVDIEARFLRVEDSFLEDVGVDFRGLGDQSSGGIPGRGLERKGDRSGFRFDDYGQPQQTSAAAPGEIGTGAEPGMFYDDGNDGDIAGRTEHLFDSTLGGGDGELDNAGGLAVQYTYLDDTELELILRAVEKRQRSEIITAPRLLVHNNTRANMSVLRHTSYIRDFEVEIAQSAAVANPVVDVVRDGVVLDVRPVVSSDRRYITMELRPTVMELQLPIPNFVTTLGVGQPISIQLPRATLQQVRTTVTMPDGATVMLGGMKLAEKTNQVSGVPILKDLPGLSFLFSRKGTFVQNKKVLILVRAQVVMPYESEPPVPQPIETAQR
jgi:type II secretory pathway component GspD/PulD (secretin)/tetratricopeptide (TPR) repeat protein